MLHSVPYLDNRKTETALEKHFAVGHSIWLTGTKNSTEFDMYLPVFIDVWDGLFS
jgi:hypothetical protein